MQLLLYNPNTNHSLTAALAITVRARLAPDDGLTAVTSKDGEAFVNSEGSIAAARASARATLPGVAGDCDAILVGCFGDLGLDDLRRELRRPIVSFSDAFLALAPFLGARVGILTTSSFWLDRIKTEAGLKGAGRWIADIRSLGSGAGAQPAAVEDECRAIIDEFASDGQCDAVVLAGAALIPLRGALSNVPLPIADPLAIGISLCRVASDALTGSSPP
jgi:allantoin racemase